MGGCFRNFLGILVLLAAIGGAVAVLSPHSSTTATSSAATPDAAPATTSAAALEDEANDAETYEAELTRQIADVSNSNLYSRADSIDDIAIEVGVMASWVVSVDKGSSAKLSKSETALRNKLIAAIRQYQLKALPALRDKFGPVMRNQLWEADGKARTIGPGYRTASFIAGDFALNRNIKTVQDQMYETLMHLRFTRVEYHWADSDLLEYQYYTLKPPKDGDLVIWNGPSFRMVK